MGDDEPAVVEDVVADQPVHEVECSHPELLRLGLQLGQRFGQAVGDGHLGALEGANELGLVVA